MGEEAILRFRIVRKRALRQMVARLKQQLHKQAPNREQHPEL